MKIEKYYIEVCNGMYDKYGGHSQWLANFLGVDYLILGFRDWSFGYHHAWYDGQHHALNIGWFTFSWGGRPYLDL
jgi:hypothetical protein